MAGVDGGGAGVGGGGVAHGERDGAGDEELEVEDLGEALVLVEGEAEAGEEAGDRVPVELPLGRGALGEFGEEALDAAQQVAEGCKEREREREQVESFVCGRQT